MTAIPALDESVSRLMELDQASAFALVDFAAERVRQIEKEGWTTAHDDSHSNGEMAYAAAAYILATRPTMAAWTHQIARRIWPWSEDWWKSGSPHRNRVKAGALLVAEHARHLRSSPDAP